MIVTQDVLDEIALSREEHRRIVDLIGREPTEVELGLFGAMWSEHCGYKNSKALLRRLPTTGSRVLQGPGENAGAVDIGDGLAVVMKIESHNHPSAVEPFQGAATGVGGIIRDIFTMGARPIALLDSLRFGALDNERSEYLFKGVVRGISFYGNCIGVPTVGGEIYFEPAYAENPLVNVMAVGLIETDKIVRSRAELPGTALLLVGADTGRDGIHGASGLASRELSDSTIDQRPTVQVGNPFLEKLLIEACLELHSSGKLIAMQDLGAAGITSAIVEAASKGGTGVEIDVDRVSRRETNMNAYEIMLSESQERMLVVVRPEDVAMALAVIGKWGLHADLFGQVTADQQVRVVESGKVVADVHADYLARAPEYVRDGKIPEWEGAAAAYPIEQIPQFEDLNDSLLKLLASPDIASKRSVYRQYDHSVQTNTLVGPGSGDSAVLRIKGTGKAIAVSVDGNGRHCYLDPYRGAMGIVAEATRNVSCVGAVPLAATDCLNFGNPEKAEIYSQLERAIDGLAAGCRGLDIPIISGNVSLYNESNGKAIFPTPILGVVGLLEDATRAVSAGFRQEGDDVWLIGPADAEEIGGSEYLKVIHGLVVGRPPVVDLERERNVQTYCRRAANANLLRSAHDCSDGGLAVALAESCMIGGIGATVNLTLGNRPEYRLFGESHSRIIVSAQQVDEKRLRSLALEMGVELTRIGRVGGDALRIADEPEISLALMREAWNRLGRL